MKFRKKPVVIEAVHLTDATIHAAYSFVFDSPALDSRIAADKWADYENLVRAEGLRIPTLEGEMRASIGDWIIKGVKGEFYPCKPDIFEATYEPAGLAANAEEVELKGEGRWVPVSERLPELFGSYIAAVQGEDEIIVMSIWFDRSDMVFKTDDHYRADPGEVIAWQKFPEYKQEGE